MTDSPASPLASRAELRRRVRDDVIDGAGTAAGAADATVPGVEALRAAGAVLCEACLCFVCDGVAAWATPKGNAKMVAAKRLRFNDILDLMLRRSWMDICSLRHQTVRFQARNIFSDRILVTCDIKDTFDPILKELCFSEFDFSGTMVRKTRIRSDAFHYLSETFSGD
ncbi:hypothetical protein [Neoasaia chiangmaiensis]|uniref:hypothetical protein n=1 Tax=Neoasaia chiangmaiensis TaxID=320497 RepID=UPI001FE5306B|nr:hypothetical protein [Neoasaia chiangmaiensis]